MLITKSAVSGSTDLRAAAKVSADWMVALLPRRRASEWKVPPGPDAKQVMPGSLLLLPSALHI